MHHLLRQALRVYALVGSGSAQYRNAMSDPLATLTPSPMRRLFAVGALGGLGILTLWLPFATPPETIYIQGLLIALGLFFVFLATRLWAATGRQVLLTEEGLFDTSGITIAEIDQIERVDRSPFAIKPSNGFVAVTRDPLGGGWAPGLWWRVGRRIGVGGVTPASQGKGMADVLAVILAERAEAAKL